MSAPANRKAAPVQPGQVFERLTVIDLGPRTKDRKRQWLCRCSCGNQKIVRERLLVTEQTRSCGCLGEEARRRRAKHRMVGTRTYRAWHNMKTRCLWEKSKSYKDYGARGIAVCERWMTFANFLQDMGECPPGLTLDRINNDRGYEPGNCRWTNRVVQGMNRRNVHRIRHQGQEKTIKEWADKTGISPSTLYDRLVRRGLPAELAFGRGAHT